jgi:hypothetical protein
VARFSCLRNIGGGNEDPKQQFYNRREIMKPILLSAIKWWLIIAFAGVNFYAVYPKYVLYPKACRFVANTITGEIVKPK